MSDQLVSWFVSIAAVLSPIVAVLFLVRRILCDLMGIALALRKLGAFCFCPLNAAADNGMLRHEQVAARPAATHFVRLPRPSPAPPSSAGQAGRSVLKMLIPTATGIGLSICDNFHYHMYQL